MSDLDVWGSTEPDEPKSLLSLHSVSSHAMDAKRQMDLIIYLLSIDKGRLFSFMFRFIWLLHMHACKHWATETTQVLTRGVEEERGEMNHYLPFESGLDQS